MCFKALRKRFWQEYHTKKPQGYLTGKGTPFYCFHFWESYDQVKKSAWIWAYAVYLFNPEHIEDCRSLHTYPEPDCSFFHRLYFTSSTARPIAWTSEINRPYTKEELNASIPREIRVPATVKSPTLLRSNDAQYLNLPLTSTPNPSQQWLDLSTSGRPRTPFFSCESKIPRCIRIIVSLSQKKLCSTGTGQSW